MKLSRIVLYLVLAVGALWFYDSYKSRSDPEPLSFEERDQAGRWLRRYYAEYGIPWTVTNIAAQGRDMRVRVEMSVTDSSNLLKRPIAPGGVIGSQACPAGHEEIWDILPRGSDIIIEATNPIDPAPFTEASCRKYRP